jgi:hypothetical protein
MDDLPAALRRQRYPLIATFSEERADEGAEEGAESCPLCASKGAQDRAEEPTSTREGGLLAVATSGGFLSCFRDGPLHITLFGPLEHLFGVRHRYPPLRGSL